MTKITVYGSRELGTSYYISTSRSSNSEHSTEQFIDNIKILRFMWCLFIYFEILGTKKGKRI
jgi:hypothetical protein